MTCGLFAAEPNSTAWWRRANILALAAALVVSHVAPSLADPLDIDPAASALDPDYAAGKKALDAKDWNAAIRALSAAARRSPANADIQNYLGFAYRKSAKLDLAFKHYKQALSLDPRHRGAHEYIGEAYLMKGDLKSAEKHLAALREICLLPCEELTDLEREIAKHVKKSPAQGSR
jgi:Flp pilus assembly protein TadD